MFEKCSIFKYISEKNNLLEKRSSISAVLKSGFSAIEVIITISFLLIIMAIGVESFRDTALNRELDSTANHIVSILELARTNSVTGKDGQNYGVKFNNDSFVTFVGSSYIESNESNEIISINNRLGIETDIPGTSESVVFSKINGQTNYNQELTITVREKSNLDNKIDVVIGILGEISVIK